MWIWSEILSVLQIIKLLLVLVACVNLDVGNMVLESVRLLDVKLVVDVVDVELVMYVELVVVV